MFMKEEEICEEEEKYVTLDIYRVIKNPPSQRRLGPQRVMTSEK